MTGRPVEVKFLNFLDMPGMSLFIVVFLAVSHLNHLHGLNVLGLTPLRHCGTTVAFPEHSSDFVERFVLIPRELLVL